MKALRKEINEILTNKLNAAVKAFQAQREQDLADLFALKGEVDKLEVERADIQKTMAGLNTRKARDLAENNRLDGKLRWIDRQLKGRRGQIDTLMTKLTEIKADPETLSLLLHFREYQEKEGGKHEKD